MTLALTPVSGRRIAELSVRGLKAVPGLLRQARADWKTAPRLIRATVHAMGFLFAASILLSYLARFGVEVVLAAVIGAGALLAVGLLLDFWRIGFRWHAQRVLYGWKAVLPWYKLGALPYRRMFVGTGLAFTAPTLYAGLRLASGGASKRFQSTVRAACDSGASRVFRRSGLLVAAAIEDVADNDVLRVLTALAEHARQVGVAEVNRYLALPVESALAALDNGLAFEYAELL